MTGGGLPDQAPATWRDRLRAWARRLKLDIAALALAVRDPRVPKAARLLAAAVVAYALSPIDLIPDFVPVLGYLDDLLLVPLGLWLVLRMVPQDVLQQLRAEAALRGGTRLPRSRTAAVVIVGLWLIGLGACAAWAWRRHS